MTDLELMYLLDECDYEPSIENVKILKEDVSLVEDLMCEARGYIKRIARGTESGEDRARFNADKVGNARRLALHKTGKNISAITAIRGHAPELTKMDASITSDAGKIADDNRKFVDDAYADGMPAVNAARDHGATTKKGVKAISTARTSFYGDGKSLTKRAQALEKETGKELKKLKKKQQ